MSQQPHPPVGATPDRRTFLRGLAALGVAGGALGSLARAAHAAPPQPRLDGAGIQLFTVRDRLAADFEGTLARLAEIGYRQVEFFTYADRTPTQVRAALDAAGLSAPSTHVVLRPGPNLERELAGFQAMGHQWARAGGPEPADGAGSPPGATAVGGSAGAPVQRPLPPPQTVAGVRRTLEQYERVATAAKPYGIRIIVHNHTEEFERLPDGRTPFDLMLAELDPTMVALELDIGWAVVAGQDPTMLFERHRGRFPLWHVKDVAELTVARSHPTMYGRQRAARIVPLGQGGIDYAPIFAKASVAGLQHYFVEQDTAPASGDSLAAARTSFEALRRLLA
jgi:sugar phosphate isomerase/epimerase